MKKKSWSFHLLGDMEFQITKELKSKELNEINTAYLIKEQKEKETNYNNYKPFSHQTITTNHC